jgi:hypothetical protein
MLDLVVVHSRLHDCTNVPQQFIIAFAQPFVRSFFFFFFFFFVFFFFLHGFIPLAGSALFGASLLYRDKISYRGSPVSLSPANILAIDFVLAVWLLIFLIVSWVIVPGG